MGTFRSTQVLGVRRRHAPTNQKNAELGRLARVGTAVEDAMAALLSVFPDADPSFLRTALEGEAASADLFFFSERAGGATPRIRRVASEMSRRGASLGNPTELCFFKKIQFLGACRRRTPRTCVDLKAPKDASCRDHSGATVRLGPALGVRRRQAPESRAKNRRFFR